MPGGRWQASPACGSPQRCGQGGSDRSPSPPTPAGSEGCCAPREEGDGDAMPGYSPPLHPQLWWGGTGKRCPQGRTVPALPPFHRWAQARLGGHPGAGPSISSSASAETRTVSMETGSPNLAQNDAYFWAEPRGDAGDPCAFASCLHTAPPHPTGSIHTGVQRGLLRGWVSPRNGCWVIQHQCSFTQ